MGQESADLDIQYIQMDLGLVDFGNTVFGNW